MQASGSQPDSASPGISSLIWYLLCRSGAVTVLLGGAAVFYLQDGSGYFAIRPVFLLIAAAYVEAFLSALVLRRIQRTGLFAQLQIAWDLLFVTALILLTGGVDSVFPFAYLLVIVSTSFLLSRRQTLLAAAGAIILFGGLLDLQYFNSLQAFGLTRTAPGSTFFSTIFVHACAFFLVGILSGTLAERWRRSEELFQRKQIDYTELERLNRTILGHINSGLLMVNPQGRIRSCNRAATAITGLSLETVYDQSLSKFFPGFHLAELAGENPPMRAEGQFIREDGAELTLGYSTTQVRDSSGGELGTLITFQDLTRLKQVEEELKRADRLAAVGRLSAAMAHEIRNPLASISGSVQLLLENSAISGEEQRLMQIVVAEADRLNGLLNNFLNFARPKTPRKSSFDLVTLVDELILLLHKDHRFRSIEITDELPPAATLRADREQVRQVLWDLAVNAAEAMAGQGRLWLGVNSSEGVQIVLEDNGPGIADAIKTRIFEPFFSTKEEGTGLGLASVHAVMEAHGGSIQVTDGQSGGACFTLIFPEDK